MYMYMWSKLTYMYTCIANYKFIVLNSPVHPTMGSITMVITVHVHVHVYVQLKLTNSV